MRDPCLQTKYAFCDKICIQNDMTYYSSTIQMKLFFGKKKYSEENLSIYIPNSKTENAMLF